MDFVKIIIEALTYVYLIGIAINALIMVYIALFRKDYKRNILAISKLDKGEKFNSYMKQYPKIFFNYLFRILGSFFTTKGFINELSKAQKYSYNEIKKFTINSMVFFTIMPTLGLFIYLINEIKIFSPKNRSFIEIFIDAFTLFGFIFSFTFLLAVLIIVTLKIAKSFKQKGDE